MVVEVPVQVYYRAELILSGWTINPCCPNVGAGNVSTYEPGTYRLRLWFDGVELRLLGYVGSFTIRLYLIDNSTHRDLYFEDYVTAGYRYEWFEEPPAAFAPPHAEYGLDTDGDGRYNFLVIEYDSFGTRFYNYTAVEEIPFLLAPPHRDYARDTDGDGLVNQIVVEV